VNFVFDYELIRAEEVAWVVPINPLEGMSNLKVVVFLIPYIIISSLNKLIFVK